MKKLFKYSQFLTLGVFLLSSSVIFAAAKECYSPAELNDFKTLYIKLQNELNYEGKDAYLDKKYQVQLKPHGKDKAYPGREFESALFGEYQNSLRKIGKLYQSAKFENDDSFKSNEVLVNFMKAIDDKSSESEDFINKTKIKDVINALEEASQKKYAKSGDKKFMINAGDKYLLEKLLTHAQDRVCSVNKFEETNKGTALFKADYLKQVKNAPLNILVNTIKNAPIEKDSKIDLRGPSDLTASLVDSDVAVQSAVADNLNQLSAWVKKVKAQGPKCLASIKSKVFANKIQNNIQGCNFGHFIETLSQDNVSNLESVLHFINANEKLLNNPVAKAETGMDELKLEGFISKTFDNLGTAVRCTQLDPANSGDKKVFIRNLPYDEKSNKFDTSGIICKSNLKILGADTCKKQFDLSSDSLGRGLEIKPKKGAAANVTFSVKDSDNCSDISFQDPKAANLATSAEQCTAQLKDGSAFVWDTKSSKCNEVEIANVSSIEQCLALKKEGSVFNWDAQKKSCGEFSALLTENVLKQAAQQCNIQKKNGYAYKWDSSKNSCDETPTIAGTKLASKISCDAKTAANLPYKWNANENSCESSPVLTAAELKAKAACDLQPAKNGFSNSWNNQSRQCNQLEVAKVSTIEQCVALKKPGSVYNWDAEKKSCGEFSALLSGAALKQSAQQCEVKGSSFKWNSAKKECDDISGTTSGLKETSNASMVLSDIKSKAACDAANKNGLYSSWDNLRSQCSAVELKKVSTIEQCVALKKEGSVFNWDAHKNSCNEFSSLLSGAAQKQAAQQCEVKQKEGSSFKWDASKNACSEFPTLTNTNTNSDTKNAISAAELAKVSSLEQCVALKKPGSVFNWNSNKNSCEESSSLLKDAALTQTAQQCIAQKKYGYEYNWDPANKSCRAIPTMAGTKVESKIACDAKISAGLPFKWNPSDYSCEKAGNDSDSRSPGSKIGDSNADSKNSDSSNATVKSGPAAASSLPADLSEKMAKMGCESKSSPGNTFKWNSSNKSCEGSVITSHSNSGGKTPIVKPIVLTNEETKPVVKNPNPPVVVGSKGPGTTNEELKNKPGTSTEEPKTEPVAPPAIKAENGNNSSPLSNLPNNSTDKVKAAVTKAQMDCEINRGPTFSWDSVKETCSEAAAVTKPAEEDASLAAREKLCIADNAEWIEKENDGRPGIKYEWDADKKECINKRPDKDGGKKVVEEAPAAEEATSAPKRAPARFTPINIPSRQIYLMPGMP
jgi:hypothetical protein